MFLIHLSLEVMFRFVNWQTSMLLMYGVMELFIHGSSLIHLVEGLVITFADMSQRSYFVSEFGVIWIVLFAVNGVSVGMFVERNVWIEFNIISSLLLTVSFSTTKVGVLEMLFKVFDFFLLFSCELLSFLDLFFAQWLLRELIGRLRRGFCFDFLIQISIKLIFISEERFQAWSSCSSVRLFVLDNLRLFRNFNGLKVEARAAMGTMPKHVHDQLKLVDDFLVTVELFLFVPIIIFILVIARI